MFIGFKGLGIQGLGFTVEDINWDLYGWWSLGLRGLESRMCSGSVWVSGLWWFESLGARHFMLTFKTSIKRL